MRTLRDNQAVSTRYFTLAEAEELLPVVRAGMAQLGALHARLQAEIADHPIAPNADGFRSREAFLLDHQMHRVVRWLQRLGVRIKAVVPALVDFPARVGDRDVLLCWRAGEDHIAWYHAPEAGFAGRRPVTELEI